MPLADGYTDLPPGKLANVVTCLEMRASVPPRAHPNVPGIAVERFTDPDAPRYRALVRRVGESSLWQSPLLITDEHFSQLVCDHRIEFWVLRRGGADEGILELDFRGMPDCELHLFGVSEQLRGTGAGRMLMNLAIERAWLRPITRLWLHTCTLDHPSALPFYIRSGFVPYNGRSKYTTIREPSDCTRRRPLRTFP